MAITKRMSLKFEATLVFPTEEVKRFEEMLVEASKKIVAGEKVDPEIRIAAEKAVTEGVEAAIEFMVVRQARAGWADHMAEIDLTKCSPLSVRFIK